MARPPAARVRDAAEALDAFLRHGDRRPRPPAPSSGPDNAAPPPAPRPPRTGTGADHVSFPRPAHTDWLHHRLTVAGPAATLQRFADASCGAGVIPWHLDLPSLEEDWFHRLIDPAHRSLSFAGARVLAGQLRNAVERRHALAAAGVGRSRACPLDLHALLPVPSGILLLGPAHPDALRWLWEHWGTWDALRRVSVQPGDDALSGPVLRFEFWSADWTPWRALLHLRTAWPALRFDLQPSYA